MSIEDCPDCRKLQSECEALERELAVARTERQSLADALFRLRPTDPRAPLPTYIPAAVPEAKPRHADKYCAICDRLHP